MKPTERTIWCKSSHSGSESNCVELAHTDEAVAIRDSKNTGGPMLMFERVELDTFLRAVKGDRFNA